MNCCADHTTTSEPTTGPTARSRTNITTPERIARVTIGTLAAVAGVVGVVGAGSTLAVVLYLLLVAAGLDLVVTGATGHCPLYQKLGYTPRTLRSGR